jgi:lysophospholipase L1-like esterase
MTIIIPPPTVTCPVSPVPVTTSNGQPAVVTYASAAVTGGTTPVSLSCTPASGSAFAVGSTAVTCTATDAVHRTASCSFTVTVTLPSPRLGVTTILAFGDSITEGEVPVAGEFAIRPHLVEPDRSYPADLTTLLASRYTAQGASRLDAFTIDPDNRHNNCTPTLPPRPTTSGIVVINAGCLGEAAESPTTSDHEGALDRLKGLMLFYHPDLVLLLEGVNDLAPTNPLPSIQRGVAADQTLVSAAEGQRARVLVGTLLPEIAGEINGGAAGLIVPFNAQLVPAVTGAGASIVDLYSDIATDVTDWISYDGLHPTEAGYQEMARVWFNSIERAFELSQTSTSTSTMKIGPVRPRSLPR